MDHSSGPPPRIDVIAPLSLAFERVKLVLFRPFDLGKWFVIGFAAFLAHLGEGGGGNYNFSSPGSGSGKSGQGAGPDFGAAKEWVMHNLGWLIPVSVVVLLLILALVVLFLWLSSRGKFMFLHCVARNLAVISEPWREYAREANSLLRLRLVLMVVSLAVLLPLLAAGVMAGIAAFGHGSVQAGMVAVLVGVVLLFILLVLVMGLVVKFMDDFLVPIMYLRRCTWREGWVELRALIMGNLKLMCFYLLFQIALAVGISMAVTLVMLVTCCFCFLGLIPYLSSVILLPVLMFRRAYSAYFLAQFGTGYDVFAAAET